MASLPASVGCRLPFTRIKRSSSFWRRKEWGCLQFLKIEVVVQFQKIEVVVHCQKIEVVSFFQKIEIVFHISSSRVKIRLRWGGGGPTNFSCDCQQLSISLECGRGVSNYQNLNNVISGQPLWCQLEHVTLLSRLCWLKAIRFTDNAWHSSTSPFFIIYIHMYGQLYQLSRIYLPMLILFRMYCVYNYINLFWRK